MYKKIILVGAVALGLSTAAFADDDVSSIVSGIYVGGQLGMSNMGYGSNSYTLPSNTVDNKKFAGRAYAGYNYNEFLSGELGYDYYGYPNFTQHPSGNTQNFLQQGIDLVAKASLPLDYGFGFFVKGGGDWVFRGALHNNTGFFAEKPSNNKVTFIGGIGASYAITPNIGTDLSWSKTMSVSDLPSIDFFALGVSYKFNI